MIYYFFQTKVLVLNYKLHSKYASISKAEPYTVYTFYTKVYWQKKVYALFSLTQGQNTKQRKEQGKWTTVEMMVQHKQVNSKYYTENQKKKSFKKIKQNQTTKEQNPIQFNFILLSTTVVNDHCFTCKQQRHVQVIKLISRAIITIKQLPTTLKLLQTIFKA